MYKKVKLSDTHSIDTDGVVWNDTTGRAMRGTTITKKNRYQKVHLDKFRPIHILVLETFVGTRPEGYTANHKDGNRYNNSLRNLEWVPHSQNVRHARKMRLHRGQYGEELGSSKLTLEQARRVYSLGSSGLTARQIRDRLRLPVSIEAVRDIMAGRTWQAAIAGTIPERVDPTPKRRPMEGPPNKTITPEEAELLESNAHLLRQHGGKPGLTINQLLMQLGLTHIKPGTAYAHIRNYRLKQ